MAMLSGAGVALIALMMIGTAAAANVNTTLVPRFHGVVAPNSYSSASGCKTSSKLSKAAFSLRTGISKIGFSGVAGACKKVPKGFTFYDSSDSSQGFEAVIALPHATNTTTNVTANFGGKYAYSASVSAGKTLSCPGASQLNYNWYNETSYDWNYNATTFSFGNYTYNDTDYGYNAISGWYSYNSTAANWGSQPSPFILNSTTEYFHYADSSVYSNGQCFSEVQWNVNTNLEVCDITGGFCWSETGSTAQYNYQYQYIELSDDVDYGGAYVDSYWEGPYGYGGNYSAPAYNDNRTGAYQIWENETTNPCCTFTVQQVNHTGATSLTTTNSVNLAGFSAWANYTQSFYYTYYCVTYNEFCVQNGDKLYAEVDLGASMYAENENWAHGSASYAFNGATLGNGIKLVSLVY